MRDSRFRHAVPKRRQMPLAYDSSPMAERRKAGTRCPQCGGTRFELTPQGSGICYHCLACGRSWSERRRENRSAIAGVPEDQDALAAVRLICSAASRDALMSQTAQWTRRLTGADGVTFVWRAGDECYYAEEEAIAPLWKGQRFPLQSCISGWAMLNRQSVIVADVFSDQRIPHDVYRSTFVRSLLMVPVRKAAPIAAIGAYWSSVSAPTDAHVQLVELLAEAATLRSDRPE